jgi:acyl dehydratase
MQPATYLQFTRRPSGAGLLVSALRHSLPRTRPAARALSMRAAWHGVRIERAHLEAFNAACGVAAAAEVSILYPMTLAYPPLLRLLSSAIAPMPLFFALNTRLDVRHHEPIACGDTLDIDLAATGVRQAEKGLELDIHASVQRDEEQVWECLATIYYRGRFHGVAQATPTDSLPDITASCAQHDWTIPAQRGFRFGRLCGDANPIHYSKTYARAFGFERDFAQPLLALGQSLSRLGDLQPALPARVQARFKAPLYYERRLKMLAADMPQGRRFDIYCEPNARPGICASVSGFCRVH